MRLLSLSPFLLQPDLPQPLTPGLLQPFPQNLNRCLRKALLHPSGQLPVLRPIFCVHFKSLASVYSYVKFNKCPFKPKTAQCGLKTPITVVGVRRYEGWKEDFSIKPKSSKNRVLVKEGLLPRITRSKIPLPGWVVWGRSGQNKGFLTVPL